MFGVSLRPSSGGADAGEDPRVSGSDFGPDHGSAELICSPTELASLAGVPNQLDQDLGEVLG
jgi:hypothetical protein